MDKIKHTYLIYALVAGAFIPTAIFGAYKYSPQIASLFTQKAEVESEVPLATTTTELMATTTIEVTATSSAPSTPLPTPASLRKKAEDAVRANVQTQAVVPQVVTTVQTPVVSSFDYRFKLQVAYQAKIELLKKANASIALRQILLETDIDDNNEFIAGSEAYQMAYQDDDDLVDLAEVGIKLKKLQNTEDQKYITSLKSAGAQVKEDMVELQSAMTAVSMNPVTLEQYNQSVQDLDALITEEDLDSIREKTAEIGDYISLRNTKIDAFIKFNATKFRDSLNSVSVQAVVDTPAPQPVVSPYGKINCTTSKFLNEVITKCTTGPAY